jgi:hypothetical protein
LNLFSAGVSEGSSLCLAFEEGSPRTDVLSFEFWVQIGY